MRENGFEKMDRSIPLKSQNSNYKKKTIFVKSSSKKTCFGYKYYKSIEFYKVPILFNISAAPSVIPTLYLIWSALD